MISEFHHGTQDWHGPFLDAIMREREASILSKLGVAHGPAWSGRKGIEMTVELEAMFRWALWETSGTDLWELTAWANVTMPGGRVGTHDHDDGRNEWSGVYYLSRGAAIEFPDANRIYHPVPGLLLIFPAQERHSVAAERGPAPRVSVAMNARPSPF